MWQFILGSNEAFEALEERARQACVRFSDQQMPPGADRENAAVGFEIDPETGTVTLLVERGIQYDGPAAEVREWFETGNRCFESLAEMRQWLESVLRPAFEGSLVVLPEDLENTQPS